jgi:hypothetical protein
MVSPYKQHTNTQLGTILLIFYILAYILNFYLEHYIIYTCKLNYFDVLYNISFKEHLPEDGHNR